MEEKNESSKKNDKIIMKLENISKTYKSKNKDVKVLTNINVAFSSNNFYAIMGHSGSGKSIY